jgi:hypothetical protein
LPPDFAKTKQVFTYWQGGAGAGKSTAALAFINYSKAVDKALFGIDEKLSKSAMVTGITGIAAINLGGNTLHRSLGIPFIGDKKFDDYTFANAANKALAKTAVY